MKTYRVDLIRRAVAGGSLRSIDWQSAATLSKADVDRYVTILEKAIPVEWEERDEFLRRLRTWGEADDGQPVYMLNVMRFFEQTKAMPGVPADIRPREANARYESSWRPGCCSVRAGIRSSAELDAGRAR